jgi:hypothetical protein
LHWNSFTRYDCTSDDRAVSWRGLLCAWASPTLRGLWR